MRVVAVNASAGVDARTTAGLETGALIFRWLREMQASRPRYTQRATPGQKAENKERILGVPPESRPIREQVEIN